MRQVLYNIKPVFLRFDIIDSIGFELTGGENTPGDEIWTKVNRVTAFKFGTYSKVENNREARI